ncbi:PAN domain protein [Trichuris suis]|nr:PAN domain protein [Trichuris suis]
MTTTVNRGAQLEEKSGAEFFQKICVDALGACLTSFNRLPQTQLIGWARDVIRGTTMQACLAKCLNTKESTAGYTCMSIMYYYQDSECVLNAESIEHHPQLAKRSDASRGDVDYFTNNCIGGRSVQFSVPHLIVSFKNGEHGLNGRSAKMGDRLVAERVHHLELVQARQLKRGSAWCNTYLHRNRDHAVKCSGHVAATIISKVLLAASLSP